MLEREFKKEKLKVIKGEQVFVGVMGLDEGVMVGNYQGGKVGKVIVRKEGQVVAKGVVLKHVPLKK